MHHLASVIVEVSPGLNVQKCLSHLETIYHFENDFGNSFQLVFMES